VKAAALITVAIVLALLPATGSAVGVYRWVDAAGQVHYSDQPIASAQRVNAALLTSREIKAVATSSAPDHFHKRVRRQCDAVKDRIATYERAAVVYGQTATGVTYRLSAEQRRDRLRDFRDQRDQYCSPRAAESLWHKRVEQAKAMQASAPTDAEALRIRGGPISRN
jgi:hypothetical protein